MKKLLMITLITLAAGAAHAAKLEDVAILDLKSGKDSFEVKLQLKDAKKDAYFLVEIVKEDEMALEKMAHVLKKQKLGNAYKLDLEIPSFSAYPSGSYYRSNSVKFSGNPSK